MHHGFVGYQGGVLLLILVSAVGGSHLPRPFSFIERGVLRPAQCLNALSSRETQGAPDRRNENCPLCRNTDAGHRIGVRLGRIMCNLSKRGAEASLSQRVLRLRSLTFFASGIGLTSTIAGCSFASTMAWMANNMRR